MPRVRLANHLQDQNAGNLGDLLKHHWLLFLIQRVLQAVGPTRVVYLESHAGAGEYVLERKIRIRRLEIEKVKVNAAPSSWAMFEQHNCHIREGLYLGSPVLAIRLLADWERLHRRREVLGWFWEKDPKAASRLEKALLRHAPSFFNWRVIRKSSTPAQLFQQARAFAEQGFTVIWLCDPYWGENTRRDVVWWKLLDSLPDAYGMMFGCVGGNSRKRGLDKFDFEKVISAPCRPWRQIPDKIRAYGLFPTAAAHDLLSVSP